MTVHQMSSSRRTHGALVGRQGHGARLLRLALGEKAGAEEDAQALAALVVASRSEEELLAALKVLVASLDGAAARFRLALLQARSYPPEMLASILDVGGTEIPAPELLKPGRKIEELHFGLPGQSLAPAAEVVLCKATIVAVRFLSLSAAEKSALSRYIYRRIS